MTKTIEAKGQCLCGAVHILANSVSRSVGACHCSMCQKWTGGPLLSVECGTEVVFEGEDCIGVFDSSAWAERGFCTRCGSNLFYRLKQSQQYFIPPGLFENSNDFVLDHQVFIDEKPVYYSFANKTKDMTGAEVFEKYAPKQN